MELRLHDSEGRRLDGLPATDLYYLASPYRTYAVPGDDGAGLRKAFTLAALVAAKLIERGYYVFSPVAHSHPVAVAGKLDPFDDDMWMGQCHKLLWKCDALIVLAAPRFEHSRGMAEEITLAQELKKPTYIATMKGDVT